MSHTATGQWQSFEQRMRRRRVARLLFRADAALDEGLPDVARACLEEAQSLAPGLPPIETLRQRLDGEAVDSPVASRRTRTWIAPAAIVAATVVVLAIALRPPSVIVPDSDFRALSLPAVNAVRPAMPAIGGTNAFPEVTARNAAPLPRVIEGEIPDDWVAPTPKRRPIANEPAPVAPRFSPPPPASPVTLPVRDGVAASIRNELESVTLPGPAASAAAARNAIRGTLDRYAAAYSALDASAAARVWPKVDRTALDRAFTGLAAQHVVLGECRIEVANATARANCAGSATWTPRIGDGTPRTDARDWTFDLSRAGDQWQIVSARVQNK